MVRHCEEIILKYQVCFRKCLPCPRSSREQHYRRKKRCETETMLSVHRRFLRPETCLEYFLGIKAVLPTVQILSVLVFLVAIPLVLWRRYIKLRHVPGPFWARWSNLPRFSWVLGRRAHEIYISLHEKHGRLVRMGPNVVSVGDPAEIRNIYGITEKFKKVRSPLWTNQPMGQ